MSYDKPHPTERTCREAVAYDLMRDILFDDPRRPAPTAPEFRAYVLDLYAECLATVRGNRPPLRPAAEPGMAAFERARSANRQPVPAEA